MLSPWKKIYDNPRQHIKNTDITLLTKVHIVKYMVFPVVMYRCELDHKEGWALKNQCFRTVVLEKTLESPLGCKEIKPVNPKRNQPKYSLEGLMLKLKLHYFDLLISKSWLIGKDPNAGKDWGQEEKRVTEDEMVGWHHQLNGHEFEQTPGDSEGQGSLMCCSPWGHKKSYITWRLNNKNNPPLPPHLQPPPCGQTCPEARGQESYQCSHLPGHWSRGAPRNGRENRRIRRQCALGVSPHLGCVQSGLQARKYNTSRSHSKTLYITYPSSSSPNPVR